MICRLTSHHRHCATPHALSQVSRHINLSLSTRAEDLGVIVFSLKVARRIFYKSTATAVTMPTRAAAAREAASKTSSAPVAPQSTVKNGRGGEKTAATIAGSKKRGAKAKVADSRDGQVYDGFENRRSAAKAAGTIPEIGTSGVGLKLKAADTLENSLPDTTSHFTSAPSTKRKRPAHQEKNAGAVNGESVMGGWDQLPHNMGAMNGESELSSAQANGIPEPPAKKANRGAKVKVEISDAAFSVKPEYLGDEKIKKAPKKSKGIQKKVGLATPESDDIKVDPITAEIKAEISNEGLKNEDIKDEKAKKKRTPAKKVDTSVDVQKKVGELLETVDTPVKRVKKGKKNPYGLTPGESPFPDFAKPTVEDCYTVNDLLATIHGKVEAPKEIPAPSLEVTGCGEVPSVLDALIRTRLSASTTSTNAGYAFAGLVARYGILKEGIGAGSVDWNAVRESDVKDIELAIKKGGLAATKSKSIKSILEIVYQHNITRTDSFIAERDNGVVSAIKGADKLTQGQKDLEISCREKGVLSLDYMHGLTADDAMTEFVQYPGIGVKTASCVILFCLRRPSFAVDTHVFRLCKWLDWVPENATRDTAFSHCEVRVPNELKYPLHQLLIRHGKTCGRCRAITGENSEGWENANCPIEHLVKRTGLRKGPPTLKKKSANVKTPKAKATKSHKKGKKAQEFDESAEDTDMDDDDDSEMSEPELIDDLEEDNGDESELSELED